MASLLEFSSRLRVLPIIHGSGDVAVAVRHHLLSHPCDCLAVPLPASFAHEVESAIAKLPLLQAVTQLEADQTSASFVPIDPCQPVIQAIRWAREERVPIAWIDREAWTYEPSSAVLPDPYALKGLSLEQFAAAVLPSLVPPDVGNFQDQRVCRLAFELHRLELEHEHVVALIAMDDWPWVRHAYLTRRDYPQDERYFEPIQTYPVHPKTLTFFTGELPFITSLYERARATLDSDEHLSIDGVKALLLEARDRYARTRKGASHSVTPSLLRTYLQYVRNLTLLERRLSPDLYTLIIAAKQFVSDGFARILLETARDYPAAWTELTQSLRMGIEQGELPSAGLVRMKSRLPGVAKEWRTCELVPEPPPKEKQKWSMRWDPFSQCSWPPEDERIESFHTHVREQAKALLGADLVRTEKFTSSVKDGIDLRETLRHWYEGSIYVREIPPARGGLEVVVFLFDVPADPNKYPWRTTWHAEHKEESTLGLFATDFRSDLVGPGIGRAQYGGVFFLFPPRPIPDIWSDPRFTRPATLEDRLLEAAIFHSRERHVAVVSPVPLKATWRRLAAKQGKRLIHLPLSRFSTRTIDQVRTLHVLNGKEIRSYAARFIRAE